MIISIILWHKLKSQYFLCDKIQSIKIHRCVSWQMRIKDVWPHLSKYYWAPLYSGDWLSLVIVESHPPVNYWRSSQSNSFLGPQIIAAESYIPNGDAW